MAIPSINDLTKYTVSKLLGASWNANFTKIVNWFTDGTADISVKTLTTGGSATIGGSLSIAGSLTIAGASTLMPIGTVLPYAGTAAPLGYLLCNGQAVSRSTYANLYIVLSTTFGIGDGTTTFNLPDLRESYMVGVGTYSAVTGTTHGAITAHDAFTLGGFKDDIFQGHKHEGGYDAAIAVVSGAGTAMRGIATTQSGGAGTFSPLTDSVNGTPRTGTVTRGKGLGMNFIIKY